MNSTLERARFNMIEQQVRPWDVLDASVLTVMSELKRELFVPDAYRALAYADIDIPIGRDSHMLSPKMVGRLLQALQVRAGDKVLEIGTGTGYVTACLAGLGGRVTSIELDPELAEGARKRLEALHIGHPPPEVVTADAMAGPAPGGPFDVIAVTASMPTEEPLPMLREQLKPGGRLFVIVGEPPLMHACLETRIHSASEIRRQSLFETSVAPLDNAPAPSQFVF
ncbi:protein-L-isoaspartate O-methyltransferase [Thiohalocapsa marina]|uniref:Protein-L-isoaspartate O-methyltransferase n=1 Tax=Thiohalocapsa marina TaxID=424902 RepID=A0A5M8FK52_9GAMM|nr:protein-L-isoaspartate O-methyltransferase [Thiohalocapsa marina]KAA6184370.1 protein-L-isoaspartate O-methyltransferase [Thiohalocapsa marina]